MTRDALEVGMAQFTLPGESISGDRYFVHQSEDHALIGVIDGLGHGEPAARAAETACDVLQGADAPAVCELLAACHERLRGTRGAAMTLLHLDVKARRLEWTGVGNISAVLVHPEPFGKVTRTELLARAGVVGLSMPAVVSYGVRIVPGDMLVAATDGVDIGFIDDIGRFEDPQKLAERLLARHCTSRDDALVLVAHMQWGSA